MTTFRRKVDVRINSLLPGVLYHSALWLYGPKEGTSVPQEIPQHCFTIGIPCSKQTYLCPQYLHPNWQG